MAISELHASHIRKVEVSFWLSGANLDPAVVSHRLGLQPDASTKRGDERKHIRSGLAIGNHTEGSWVLSSVPHVLSKDINDHFRWLLRELLPQQEAIIEFRTGGETYFDILWTSTYLYAGTGPLIEADCLAGVAALGAGMGFDIYQVDEESHPEP